MISMEQCVSGASRYIDAEIIPHLPTGKALIASGMAALYARRAPEIVQQLSATPAISVLGIVSGDGMIDVDALYNSFAPRMSGTVPIQIPLVGKIDIDRAELDKLMDYICGRR